MPESHHRPVDGIDAEIRALGAVTRGALSELAEVRRRQAELLDMEAALVVAIGARSRRIDGLLDERLRAAPERGGATPSTDDLRRGRPACGTLSGAPGPASRRTPGGETRAAGPAVLPEVARPGAEERP